MSRKIGILCAGDREAAPFMKHIENMCTEERAMLRIHHGTVGGIAVAVLYSGVCKVNAAIAAQAMIDCCGVDAIINAGTAGGMDERLEVFDTVISTEAVYHDVVPTILTEFHPWMKTERFMADEGLLALAKAAVERLGCAERVLFGRMATGEQFIEEAGRKEIRSRYAPLTVDMETAAVAHVCYVNRVPFLAIRCITDTAKQSGENAFDRNCDRASAIAKDITLALLEEIGAAG